MADLEDTLENERKAEHLRFDAVESLNQGDYNSASKLFREANKLHQLSKHAKTFRDFTKGTLDYFEIENFILELEQPGGSAVEYFKIAEGPCIEIIVNKNNKIYFDKISTEAEIGETKVFSGKEYLETCKKIAKEMALQYACEDDIKFREWNKRYELAAQVLANLNGERQ